MIIERKKNAVRGTFFGIILKIVQIIFPFIIRTIFIYSLGVEYLGLNSLFTAILQVLNLAELGVSSALVFSMYKPIVDNDTEKICQLMNLYKLYYRIIGLCILAIGLIIFPFIPRLIKGNIPNDINVYYLYIMNLSATVLSYWLFAYRSALFEAHQRNDIISIIRIIVNICLYSLQAGFLLIFRNYYIYLILTIIAQILTNIITAIVSKKYYPSYNPTGNLSNEEQKAINKKVRDLFTSKVGGVINNAADSIVISSVIGLEILAIYQNYYYIISAIMAIFNIFFSACTAGIGNSLIVNDQKQNRILLYKINHIVFFLINFCCACFVSLCQPFINVWVGDKYKLETPFVILFAIYLFAEEAPRTLIVFKDAGGIWKHDRFRPLLSASINLLLNVLLTPLIGLYGVIISTIFAMMFISFPWVIINIDKRLFKIEIKAFLYRFIQYTIITILSSGISYVITIKIDYFVHNIWTNMVIRFMITAVVSTGLFYVMFFKTEENRYLIDSLKSIFHRKEECKVENK